MVKEKNSGDEQVIEASTAADEVKTENVDTSGETRGVRTATRNKKSTKKSVPKVRKAKSPKRKVKTKNTGASPRQQKPFPSSSFEEALIIPEAIQKHASGQKVRRLTLFDQMDRSPASSMSRQWITNASRYGLIIGSHGSEYLELTPEGDIATNAEAGPRERAAARFRLAISQFPAFKAVYESQLGNRLPAGPVLEDILRDSGVPEEYLSECAQTFVVNAKFVGVLKLLAGAERIIQIEHALEDLPRTSRDDYSSLASSNRPDGFNERKSATEVDFDKTCFYISPIGEEDTENRKHADLFLGSIVEPALEEFGLSVVRADRISKPGMITSQILEYILKAKLVVADLSFHNPNVFYELALRHICRLPTVQVIRYMDPIPFDLDQYRTIQIDTTDIYSLVPKLEVYKAEIATQVRAALANPDSVDNPVSTYYPNLKVTF
jgi:hypothetical protein